MTSPFGVWEPPAADRHLDEEIVRHAIRDDFPEWDIQTVEAIGAGWEREVFLVDGRVVVHFPRYAAVAEDLGRHARILEFINGSVGSEVRVPEITLWGDGGVHFPHAFFGHELIPGREADPLKPPSSPRLAADLGKALSAVHAISVDSARDLGFPVQPWTGEADLEVLRRQNELVDPPSDMVPAAFEWLTGSPEVPREYAGPERFVHNDLQPEHIIVAEAPERLSGIIDWTAASLGDPSLDFSYLLVLHGKAFLYRALEAYSLPTDPEFLSRVRFRARVRALGWLVYALHRKAHLARVLREVENAFSA